MGDPFSNERVALFCVLTKMRYGKQDFKIHIFPPKEANVHFFYSYKPTSVYSKKTCLQVSLNYL